MARHTVGLKIDHELPIRNVDIQIPVWRDGRRLGVVTISKGGIDWRRNRARSSVSLTWAKFAQLMSEQ
jgi:hypothetical protein